MLFKTVDRQQLYFGQYKYCIAFYMEHANVLRDLDPIKILKLIEMRNQWDHRRERITVESQHALIQICDYLLARPNVFKRTVSGDHVWIYTNTPRDFVDLHGLGGAVVKSRTEANQCHPSGVVVLKNPRHAYRTFFRERWLRDSELRGLRDYFEYRPNQFRLSPGFAKVVTGRRMWLMGNHFVDHNEAQADVLINMAVPGVIKKTLRIVARD